LLLKAIGKVALNLGHPPKHFFQAIEKDALSLDDLVARGVKRKPFGAVNLGKARKPPALRGPFHFKGLALDAGGVKSARHSKRGDPFASWLNGVAERDKLAFRAKASLFLKLPYGSRIRRFVLAKFSFRDGPTIAVLFAPEWPTRVDEQNHRLATSEAIHENSRAALH
jgi:hypothetical protein